MLPRFPLQEIHVLRMVDSAPVVLLSPTRLQLFARCDRWSRVSANLRCLFGGHTSVLVEDVVARRLELE